LKTSTTAATSAADEIYVTQEDGQVDENGTAESSADIKSVNAAGIGVVERAGRNGDAEAKKAEAGAAVDAAAAAAGISIRGGEGGGEGW
jgi:hypothetical protein